MCLAGGRDGVGVEACDRGWTLQWMRPAGLHIVLQAAWLEWKRLSRSTANLTNSGACVGRQIAARHGCPRIRFKLVVWPCHGALLPRIKPSAERLVPQASSPQPQCLHVSILFRPAKAERRPAEACAEPMSYVVSWRCWEAR